MQVVVLEVRHLQVRREDRHAHRDGVALVQEAIALQRLEDVAHGGGAALDRVDLELALRVRLAAHRPLQVLVDDLFVVHQHAVGHRVVVADDRVDELVDELVGIEAELLHRPRRHPLQEGRARHVLVLGEPGVEPPGNAFRLRHAADAGRQIEHALALGDGELPEQEEGLARFGGDPVRIAASRIQEGERRVLRGLHGDFGDEVLDLERAQLLVLFVIQVFHCFVLQRQRFRSGRVTRAE